MNFGTNYARRSPAKTSDSPRSTSLPFPTRPRFSGTTLLKRKRENHAPTFPPASRRSGLPDWQIESGELVRTFKFEDFVAAMGFVNRVADLAEAAAHHPDIDIRYNRVRLALVTHDAGGITGKDFDLAAAADQAL